ncbi:hypothetical protein HDU67_008321 [Dinochytrium kinnereticum]|nr:hypothetical protein HDU67_008321 [Dinochytrium kinnereticum]
MDTITSNTKGRTRRKPRISSKKPDGTSTGCQADSNQVHGKGKGKTKMAIPANIIYPSTSDMKPANRIIIDSNNMDEFGAPKAEDSIPSYIEWLGICLNTFDEIEIIGVDPALPKTISIALLLTTQSTQDERPDRPLPPYFLKSIETITLSTHDKSLRSGIRLQICHSPLATSKPLQVTARNPQDSAWNLSFAGSQSTWAGRSV